MTSLRLLDIEKKSWRAVQRDGLLDALLGWILVGLAATGVLGASVDATWIPISVFVGIEAAGLIAQVWLRKRFVAPRIGRVRFSVDRRRRVRTMRIVLGVCVGLTTIIVLLTAFSTRLGFSLSGDLGALGVWLVAAAVVLVPLGGLAFFLEAPRLVVYAAFIVLAEFLHIVVDLGSSTVLATALAYGIGGVLGLTVGLTVFTRFVRRIPRAEAAPDGGDAAGGQG